MKRNKKNKKQAIILLHEIYGVNDFIKKQCQKYQKMGFDIFCPNLLEHTPFLYEESDEAYNYFVQNVGFDKYTEINNLANSLKKQYNKIFLLGFSAGATIAWRCGESSLYSGIIACYGSRIRDYTDLNPVCPTLLLFAKEDSFDVSATVNELQYKKNVSIKVFDASHEFLDPYSEYYNDYERKKAEAVITQFINQCIK